MNEPRRAAIFRPRLGGPGFRAFLLSMVIEHFSSMVAPVTKGRMTEQQVAARARQLESFTHMARYTPMPHDRIAATIVAYLGLCAGLLWLMWSLRTLEGTGNPMQFLR